VLPLWLGFCSGWKENGMKLEAWTDRFVKIAVWSPDFGP
jgi:hypothetical protein